MKVLVATQKPFAKAAVDGIRAIQGTHRKNTIAAHLADNWIIEPPGSLWPCLQIP